MYAKSKLVDYSEYFINEVLINQEFIYEVLISKNFTFLDLS